MVIPFDEVPFQVRFIAVKDKHREEAKVSFFTDSEEELLAMERRSVVLTENTEYEVVFESERPEAQLFLDILDALPLQSPIVQISSDDTPYVIPGAGPVRLFADGYIPWIPGIYHLCVRLRDKAYYASVQVQPKLMNAAELEVMRTELSEEVRGLAYQLARRQLTPGHPIAADVSGLNILQFHVILRYADSLTAAALDLMDRANHGIIKTYENVPANGAAETDEWAIGQMLKRPPARGTVLTPRRGIGYDRIENRWIVFVTDKVLRSLAHMNEMLQRYAEQLRRDIDVQAKFAGYQKSAENEQKRKQILLRNVEEYMQTTNRVTRVLRMLQTAPWYQSIRSDVVRSGRPAFTHVLVSDSRYRVFYQVYRELNNEELQIDVSTRYALQWRPTSQLYEMWGFLKVLKAVTKLGFVPVTSWFYEGHRGEQRVFVDEMQSGVSVSLERGSVRLRLIYDGEIPTRVHQTSPEQPLYTTQSHNRPDGRLDVYHDGAYFGSLMFDFKYRPIANFWSMSWDIGKRPREMNQISAYQGGCKSRYLYGTHSTPVDTWPVREVWAIHPSGGEPVQEFADYYVKLVRLTPGQDDQHLQLQLQETIDGILAAGKLVQA
ncbi:hypothetical protein GCM10025857_07740 [Alicyclobacillus contaminans]|uniref:DUF2357 domain-containing protein n=1 Tax=Alicyclobacillus contaminans TaxID=392016 RepID=UPI0003F763AC|nr:DUF2357 domain-containing protein [Alicyclobacillus contaminans]GMA49417.1 hypothetical protein GCM10025857_07740 [Alicyclobacillus contaminans]